MIAAWMLRMLIASALIALGARAAEAAAGSLGRPRRWVWAAALALVVALPWLGGLVTMPAPMDGWVARLWPDAAATVPLGDGFEVAVSPMANGAATHSDAAATTGALDAVLLGGWAMASLAVALLFARAMRRVHAVRRGAPVERAGTAAPSLARSDGPDGPGSGQAGAVRSDHVDVARSETLGPATVGILRPAIVLPHWIDDVPADERALIVEHERAHAAARDPALLAAAALPLLAAPWCLPLWWMHRRLRDAAEADCDARVLARGVDRRLYGNALLHTAGRPSTAPITAPALTGANPNRLERRIVMMTEPRPRHPWMRAVPLAALAALAAFIGCDAAGEVPSAPADEPEAEASRIVPAGDISDVPIVYIDDRRAGPFQDIAALGIETSEIRSIEILKGAAAEAFLEGESAPGVIRITTK